MSQPPRFLVTGANGQLGWELARVLDHTGSVTRVGRSEADFADPDAVRRIVIDAAPTVVFNTAAYTAVDRAESEPDLARLVNTEAVGTIGAAAKDCGAAVVHFSTDFVFDGAQRTPYAEGDRTNPLNVYGRTKLGGEEALARSGAVYLIIRTSWVYSSRGHNFVRTMLRLARERDELRVVSDQIGSPTSARWLAEVTAGIAIQASQGRSGIAETFQRTGVLHLSGGGETSWYELAKYVLTADPQKQEHRAKQVTAIHTTEFAAAARRPAYGVLDCSKARRLFGVAPSDWRRDVLVAVEDAIQAVPRSSNA